MRMRGSITDSIKNIHPIPLNSRLYRYLDKEKYPKLTDVGVYLDVVTLQEETGRVARDS